MKKNQNATATCGRSFYNRTEDEMAKILYAGLEQELRTECVEKLRKLIAKYGFLQLENKTFDAWDNNDAAEVVADLIKMINSSSAIAEAHFKYDWGK